MKYCSFPNVRDGSQDESPVALPRACGPRALAHVLNKLGDRCTPVEIHPEVVQPDPFGTLAARSYRLARYATNRGFAAATLRCRPQRIAEVLHWCATAPAQTILNHRSYDADGEGHFSVLRSYRAGVVELWDPYRGPELTLSLEDFARLWQPNREISGWTLVMIGRCRSEPAAAACPRCHLTIRLEPAVAFDRPEVWGTEGWLQQFFCAGCDAAFAPRKIGTPPLSNAG